MSSDKSMSSLKCSHSLTERENREVGHICTQLSQFSCSSGVFGPVGLYFAAIWGCVFIITEIVFGLLGGRHGEMKG